jgi:uncharacterized protein YjbJ (UPF0337 family)
MIGDKELKAEGKLDAAKGDAQNIVGDVRDAFPTGPNSAFV